ncbi:ORF3b [Alphamesonivirus casuarinaense]|uniref:ORF3b n=1 Tax=Alphamesonivirus casuarinaense TaxID=1945562 RepID=M4JWT6_9NIDO|nr:ORF3b [Alphamesonivirus 4]AGE00068.1 ORF3b [Alphamesonivirus 4]
MLRSMLCIRTAHHTSQTTCITSPYYLESLTAAIRLSPQQSDLEMDNQLLNRINKQNRLRRMYEITVNTISCSYKIANFLYYIFTILYYGFCLIMIYILWVYFNKLTNQIQHIYHDFSKPYS